MNKLTTKHIFLAFLLLGLMLFIPFIANAQSGDVNGDGELKSTDMILTLNYIRGSITLTCEQHFYADVNGNGIVNETDVVTMQQAIAGNFTLQNGDAVYGDFNGDGIVDSNPDLDANSDFIVLNFWFQNGIYTALGDLNRNGIIDGNDYRIFRNIGNNAPLAPCTAPPA